MKCHVFSILLFLTTDCQCLINQTKTNKVSGKAGKWEVELLIIFSCEDLKNTTLILPSQAGVSLQAGLQLYYFASQCWLQFVLILPLRARSKTCQTSIFTGYHGWLFSKLLKPLIWEFYFTKILLSAYRKTPPKFIQAHI